MEDKRKQSLSRFAQTVIEQNVAPPHNDKLIVATQVPRTQTPIGMPAPPAVHAEGKERQSHDDLEQVMQLEKAERERAMLLVKLQDSEEALQEAQREARKLRQREPVALFPPQSIPPAKSSLPPPALQQAIVEGDIERIQKAVASSRIGRWAITVGVALALGWNAFNTQRIAVPTQKAEATQARQAQTEKLSADEIKSRTLESERNYQRWRATYCALKQLRGASARQGLDLPSLPPGGVKALRLGDEDPNRPGPPRFVAEEVCPEFPALPPESGAR